MGTPVDQQPPVKLFFAVMAGDESAFGAAEARLEAAWGAIDMRDEAYDFDPLTDYYAAEFGTGLRKRIVASRDLVAPEALVDVKLACNRIERDLTDSPDPHAPRVVNIDPGYLSLSKVVLASTKDHYHRLYIGRGIFEEVTLTYRRREGGYMPFEWTYRDYRMAGRAAFLRRLRARYVAQLKEVVA